MGLGRKSPFRGWSKRALVWALETKGPDWSRRWGPWNHRPEGCDPEFGTPGTRLRIQGSIPQEALVPNAWTLRQWGGTTLTLAPLGQCFRVACLGWCSDAVQTCSRGQWRVYGRRLRREWRQRQRQKVRTNG